MPAPVWESTLESFRYAAASGESTPAGVAIAAVSASFALGLLAKVLALAGRRKDFAGDLAALEKLGDAARAGSRRMLEFSEEDIAAFSAYMTSARLPQATDREREERKRAMDSAARKAIEVPLAAARAAASGIGLCDDAKGMVHAFVAADLGAAASLLASSLRVFLLCADSNIRQLAPESPLFPSALAGRAGWENKALRQAEAVAKHAAAAINASATKRRKQARAGLRRATRGR
jgi:formiminotetrahydrofolate cyclodeaminase